MIGHDFKARLKRTGNEDVNVEIDVELTYDPEYDPYAVQIILSAPDEEDVVWTVGRDLLVQGVNSYTPVGSGDVRFRYLGILQSTLLLCLRNGTGHADIALPHRPVINFLNETTAAVPLGSECATDQLDEALQEILNS